MNATEKTSNNNDHTIGRYLTSFQRNLLQKSLQEELSSQYRQRILIMLLADEGKTQSEICQAVNCCSATARHWILIAQMGIAHQWQKQSIGRPKAVNDHYLERLQELVSHNPQDYGYAFQQWTGHWLSKHLTKELGIQVNERHINRLLKQMGLSTRPKPQDPVNSLKNSKNSRISIEDLSSAELSKSLS